MYRYFLAFRYVLSRPINLLGMIGLAVGVWALIVVVAIFSGYLTEVKRHISGATADLTVNSLPRDADFERVAREIQADPNVAACSPRVLWFGLMHPTQRAAARPTGRTAATSLPGADRNFVSVVAIDPGLEAAVSGIDDWIERVAAPELRVPEPLDPLATIDGQPSILISTARAKAHGLRYGDEVSLSSGVLKPSRTPNDEQLDLVEARFRVGGCFESGYAGFDGPHVVAHIDDLRRLVGASNGPRWVNEIAIKVVDKSREEATQRRLYRRLNDDLATFRRRVRVLTATQTNLQELSNIDHQRSLMKLVLFVIMVVAAFLVFATLSMMVTEKTHDIGILTALGATRRGVLVVFLACGTTISTCGAVFGVLTGCLSAIYTDAFNSWLDSTFGINLFPTQVYNLTHVPCDLELDWILTASGSAALLGIVVSAIPAWRAARHDPMQSLRNE